MSVPGVNVIVAASFLAAIGDIHRFQSARKLAGYLGLDPRVRRGPGRRPTATSQSRGSVRARPEGARGRRGAARPPGTPP